jgi:hypothetical protein
VLAAGVAAFLVGWTIALGFFSLADRQGAGTRSNTLLTGVGLFVALGGSYLGWKGLQHLRASFRGTR